MDLRRHPSAEARGKAQIQQPPLRRGKALVGVQLAAERRGKRVVEAVALRGVRLREAKAVKRPQAHDLRADAAAAAGVVKPVKALEPADDLLLGDAALCQLKEQGADLRGVAQPSARIPEILHCTA